MCNGNNAFKLKENWMRKDNFVKKYKIALHKKNTFF